MALAQLCNCRDTIAAAVSRVRPLRALLILCFVFQASAGVIYSNLNTDVISSAAAFYDVGPEYISAFEFTLPAGQQYRLDAIQIPVLALNYLDPSMGTMADIFLYSGSPSGLPGSVLEPFTAQVPGSSPPQFNPITEVQSALHPVLEGGVAYWLAITPHPDSVTNVWMVNDTGQYGRFALSFASDGQWIFASAPEDLYSAGGFRILGAAVAVPEPSSFSLILPGMAVLAAFTGLYRKASSTHD